MVLFTAGFYGMSKLKYIQNAGLDNKTLFTLFTIKVLAGIATGLVSIHLFNSASDYIAYNNLGKIETDNLFHHPKIFFTDIFISNYETYGDVFGTSKSFWKDLGPNIILKILSIFNIISGGSYYVNCLLFNMIAFVGNIAFFRFFKVIYPEHSMSIIVGCFLLPSTLYFCSGIHKDLFIFTALGIFSHAFLSSLLKGVSVKKIVVIFISFLLIFFIRNYVAVILLPCTVFFMISYKSEIKLQKIFFVAILAFFVGLFIMEKLNLQSNPLKIITERQASFIALGKANTDYHYEILAPTINGFAKAFPSAVRRSFLSPLPFEFKGLMINLLTIEICFYLLLVVLLILFRKKENWRMNNFILFGMIFTTLIFLIIGYSITNAGSVVRYRSIYLPFLIVPILCNIDWNNVKAFFSKKKIYITYQ